MSDAAVNPGMMASGDSDSELLRRYASRREADAFAELVRRYGGFVFSVARRVTGDSHDAEDVTQQCFLELARRARTISGSLSGWLHRAAFTRSLNARRDKLTRRAREAVATPEPSGGEEPAWAELEPLIDDAIAALPDDLRLPLVLHYLERKSQVEVAEELGMNQSTVSRRLGQGVEALRQRLTGSSVALSVTALASRLSGVPGHVPPPALMASLVKVGLAGVGQGVAGATQAVILKLVVTAAVLITIGAAIAIIRQMQAGPPALVTAVAAPAARAGIAPVGFVCDTLGRPVSNAYIASSLKQIWYGIRSDASGNFKFNDPRVGRGISFAYSQRSSKMAVFSVPESIPASSPPVVLQWNVASADGNVLDAAGAPVTGVPVHIFVTMPDGRRFLAVTTNATDNSGYYVWHDMIPSGPGLKIQASLSMDPASMDSTPAVDTNGRLQIEFPDLIDRGGTGAAHPGPKRVRYSGRVVDENGGPIAGVIVSMTYPFQHMIAEAVRAAAAIRFPFSLSVIPADACIRSVSARNRPPM